MRRGYGIVMNASTLSDEERAYLLGLYFADGWIRERHECDSTTLYLIFQGNEVEIANRVTGLHSRAGLRPVTRSRKGEYSILLSATGKNLLSFFGRKRSVRSPDTNIGLRWMADVGGLEIPFIAGLLDGDGSVHARAISPKRSIFGAIQVDWVFAQTRFPFLIDFVHEYVNSLVSGGATVVVSPQSRRRRVVITSRGRDILLRGGIARFSCKVKWFLSCLEKIKGEIGSLRSRFLTTGEVARRLRVYGATVDDWCREGLIKHMLVCSSSSKGRGSYRHIVPVEEIERLESAFSREKKLAESTEAAGGVRLVEVAKILRVSRSTLETWVRVGKLRATLVVKGRGRNPRGRHRYYVIPRDEVERLKRELLETDKD
jgi:DNA-binding transcriptional MerR regulator